MRLESQIRERDVSSFQKKGKFKQFYKTTNKKIVYISTCSINDISRSNRNYAKNKIQIESLFKKT